LADVRFSNFSHSPQLVIPAILESVSRDLIISDDNKGGSYFLARLRITTEGMNSLGDRILHPGMPVEVIIKTGERSMMTYLLSPITRRLAASMIEE